MAMETTYRMQGRTMSDRRPAPMTGMTVLCATHATSDAAELHLHLYVAVNTLHTQRAMKNLAEIVSQLGRPVDASETEIVSHGVV